MTFTLSALSSTVLYGLAAHTAPVAQEPAALDYSVKIEAPDLALEGEPWRVSVEVIASSERPVPVPTWLVTRAALEVDGRALGERTSGTMMLEAGQRLKTSVDLAPVLAARNAESPSDFKLSHGGGGEPLGARYLRRAEKGIDFMTLPAEQLGEYQVVMLTTAGTFWMEFWPDVAPNHVRNFLDLAYTGFYDGSRFHRVIPGFMAQGGQSGDGKPAPRKVNKEFSTRRHVGGVLSAARLGNDENSASSEFFLMHKPTPSLDGQYSAYGALVAAYPPNLVALEKLAASTETHLSLINALKRVLPIDQNHPLAAMQINNPNPPQMITRATVVKAPRLR